VGALLAAPSGSLGTLALLFPVLGLLLATVLAIVGSGAAILSALGSNPPQAAAFAAATPPTPPGDPAAAWRRSRSAPGSPESRGSSPRVIPTLRLPLPRHGWSTGPEIRYGITCESGNGQSQLDIVALRPVKCPQLVTEGNDYKQFSCTFDDRTSCFWQVAPSTCCGSTR
jgi:hypothetical protein